ncbi:MAG TPA: PilZ domain-containing protein [Phycisphaerae bacterium]|nr:PilZ domain-containing protein [Phycisphaerae bacterium]
MSGHLLQNAAAGTIAQAMNALDRLRAASSWTRSMGGSQWLGLVLVMMVLGTCASIGGVVLYRAWRWRRQQARAFAEHAGRMGLSGPERHVLHAAVKAGKLRNVEAVFHSAIAFETGVAALLRGTRVASMNEARQRTIAALVESLRQKLAFDRPEPGTGPAKEPPAEAGIARGDELRVVYRGQATELTVQVAESSPGSLLVEPRTPINCRAGESWLMRYSKGGTLWEIDASVEQAADGRVLLNRTGRPRFINRRRFPRVPLRRPARVATFPFRREGFSPGPKDYVEGELVEIAGPGLRLEVPVHIAAGERVLLALKLSEDEVVEALGKVHSTRRGEAGGSTLVVELMGLTETEIATLTRETNAAARAHATQATGAAQRQAPEPAGAGV